MAMVTCARPVSIRPFLFIMLQIFIDSFKPQMVVTGYPSPVLLVVTVIGHYYSMASIPTGIQLVFQFVLPQFLPSSSLNLPLDFV